MNEMNSKYLLFFIIEFLTRVIEDRGQCSQLIFESIPILLLSVSKLKVIQASLEFSILPLVGCQLVFPVVIFKLNEKQQAKIFQ